MNLADFRNIKTAQLEFNAKINLFYGENGQGKTSLLEAIFALCFTRSFRERSDSVLKNYNSKGYELLGHFLDGKKSFAIKVIYDGEKKSIFFNQSPVKKYSDLVGNVPVVVLTPNDLKLTGGGPAERRAFFDIVISQAYPGYMNALQRLKEAVRQKNELLGGKQIFPHERDLISAWNEVIAKSLNEIVSKRREFTDWMNRYANETYKMIAGDDHRLKINYNPSVEGTTEEAQKFLDTKLNEEITKRISLYGPLRDDINIDLNGYSIRQTGSQGENKTAVIVLKLLEIRFLQEQTKTNPIILFDDIFSELDDFRIQNLLQEVVKLGQVFVTSTTPWYKEDNRWQIRYFNVSNGNVVQA